MFQAAQDCQTAGDFSAVSGCDVHTYELLALFGNDLICRHCEEFADDEAILLPVLRLPRPCQARNDGGGDCFRTAPKLFDKMNNIFYTNGIQTMVFKKLFSGAYVTLKMLCVPTKKNNYNPVFLQSNMALCIVILLFFVKIIASGLLLPLPQNTFFADITRTSLITLLNQNRAMAGLSPLQENSQLDKAALLKAQDMLQHHYFSHQSPLGFTPWYWFLQAGYKYKYAGENLAVGFIESGQVFDAWFNSQSHRENLLNPNYRDVGTAIVEGFGANNEMLVVQVFGSLPARRPPTKTQQPAPPIAQVSVLPPSVSASTGPLVPESFGTVPSATAQDQPYSSVPTEKADERVLGDAAQIHQGNQVATSRYSRMYTGLIHFLVYDQEKVVTYASYIFLVFVVISLLLSITINPEVSHAKLMIRSFLLIIILSTILLFNQETLTYLNTYHITI